MRLSQYFLPVLKEDPSEAQIVSHRLMLRAGMIKQQAAGIYSWLPLGLQVLKNIEQIIREEMNRAGALELLMPTLQVADLWRESGREEAYGKEMLRIKDRADRDLLYGPTAEEVVNDIFRSYVRSYKALPMILYNIQGKFRDEVRPRFGVMRGREFLMKDAYSFDIDEAAARHTYNKMYVAYLRIFSRMGLKILPMRAETGPIGGDLSHEFIVLAETGESAVFCHKDLLDMPIPDENIDFTSDLEPIVQQRTRLYAATEDVHDAARFEKEVPAEARLSARGIEVGQIFYYGKKYSIPMKVGVMGSTGTEIKTEGGCYGIGVSRLVGAIIEASHDDKGIIWPESIAPFKVGIINMRANDEKCTKACEDLYARLTPHAATLYDDRDASAGEKFATQDLIGTPWQIVIGPKGLEKNIVEVKNRKSGEKQELSVEAALNIILR